MANSISFMGRLGSDAELKEINGTPLLEMNVANNVGFKDNKVTNWFRCNLWGKQASSLERFLTKGKQVYITGELTLKMFTNKEGLEKTSAEIRVDRVDFVSDGSGTGDRDGSQPQSSPQATPPVAEETEGDLPF